MCGGYAANITLDFIQWSLLLVDALVFLAWQMNLFRNFPRIVFNFLGIWYEVFNSAIINSILSGVVEEQSIS